LKSAFTDVLRVVNIDEAHCVNVWGGSFRKEYAALGILRGKLPNNISMTIASATLPEHVLDDICGQLEMSKNMVLVRLTNARPNVALSVRTMQHSDVSKADLRFLIPPTAKSINDIAITLVYCNQRKKTEECTDRTRDWAVEQEIDPSCIAFYHALIGQARKRELEEALAAGRIRILYATQALGMVRSISQILISN
jgi:superfamily II DNA helicase RecQ